MAIIFTDSDGKRWKLYPRGSFAHIRSIAPFKRAKAAEVVEFQVKAATMGTAQDRANWERAAANVAAMPLQRWMNTGNHAMLDKTEWLNRDEWLRNHR